MPTASASLAHPLSSVSGAESRRLNRRFLVVGAVVGFHVLAVWALQSGLLRRAVEMVIPVQVLAEIIEPAQPQVTPEPPPPKPVVQPPKPKPKPVARQQPAPQPVPQQEPSPVAPIVAPPEPAPPAVLAAPAPPAPPAPLAPPAPPRIELPSSSADYLNNPRPPYPALSKRMGEQGKVVVRAFIGTDGTASRAEVHNSSGYERLDQTAVQTVLRWRYVPGKRNGVAEAMWFNIPIVFELRHVQ
jgi:periplasmic protein TonB